MKPVPEALSMEAILVALTNLDGWTGDESGLKKHLVFEEFRGAIAFMTACVSGIEERDHHPVWTNKYNAIDIHLDTFDIGHKVSVKDVNLARYLDSILDQHGAEFGYSREE